MGHEITAILTSEPLDADAAARFDLRPIALTPSMTLVHINHYLTAYWQAVCKTTGHLDVPCGHPAVFPREVVILHIVRELTRTATPTFAIVRTEYFGGIGDQWACVFRGERRTSRDDASINDALRNLGIVCSTGADEFDTVRLGDHRSSPDDLDRYIDLCEQLGV